MRPSDDPATRNFYLQTARDQVDEQFQRSRGMESRAATIATVACAKWAYGGQGRGGLAARTGLEIYIQRKVIQGI